MFINRFNQGGYNFNPTTLSLSETGGDTTSVRQNVSTNQAVRVFNEIDRNGDGIASRNEVSQYKQELSQTKLLLQLFGGLFSGFGGFGSGIQKRLDVANLFQNNYDRFAQANNDGIFSQSDIRRVANTDGDGSTISQIDIENRVFNPNGLLGSLGGNRFLSSLLLPLLSLFSFNSLSSGLGDDSLDYFSDDSFSNDVFSDDLSGSDNFFSDNVLSGSFIDGANNVTMFNQNGTNLFQSIGFGSI